MSRFAVLLLLVFSGLNARAASFPLPPAGDALVGEIGVATARYEDTLVDIAREHGLGFDEIVNANPAVDAWLPRRGTSVVLPHRYLLPDAPREGIVVNVAEMRLYYYPGSWKKSGKKKKTTEDTAPVTVETFPISIGRSDWRTPLVSTRVVRKVTDPVWYPPASLRRERAQQGDPPLPDAVHPGPDNPLGQHALYLGTPSYLIHGTNREYGIGMQVTHGCMRMYPEDIRHLYEVVPVGAPVRIVNQPVKVGWSEGALFVEVHPPLEGSSETTAHLRSRLQQLIQHAVQTVPDYPVDGLALEQALIEADGLPMAVGPVMLPF